MPKKTPVSKRSDRLSSEEFRTKYSELFAEEELYWESVKGLGAFINALIQNQPLPSVENWPRPLDNAVMVLRDWSIVRLLERASIDNCPDTFKDLLEYLLAQLHVWPPEGVLVPTKGPPGRPITIIPKLAWKAWVDAKRPTLDKNYLENLAKALCKDEWDNTSKLSPPLRKNRRKNIRDRLLQNILYYEKKTPARKTQYIS